MKYQIKLVKGAEDEIIKTPVMNKKKSVSLNMNFTEKELQLMKAISGLKGNVENDQIIKAFIKSKLSYGI